MFSQMEHEWVKIITGVIPLRPKDLHQKDICHKNEVNTSNMVFSLMRFVKRLLYPFQRIGREKNMELSHCGEERVVFFTRLNDQIFIFMENKIIYYQQIKTAFYAVFNR